MFEEAARLNGTTLAAMLAAASTPPEPASPFLSDLEDLFSQPSPSGAPSLGAGHAPQLLQQQKRQPQPASACQTSPAGGSGGSEQADCSEAEGSEKQEGSGELRLEDPPDWPPQDEGEATEIGANAPHEPQPKRSRGQREEAGSATQAPASLASAAAAVPAKKHKGASQPAAPEPPPAEQPAAKEVTITGEQKPVGQGVAAQPNSVSHPREYKQFLRQIAAKHDPVIDGALHTAGKASLFQQFLSADCDLRKVAGSLQKEVEKATCPSCPSTDGLESRTLRGTELPGASAGVVQSIQEFSCFRLQCQVSCMLAPRNTARPWGCQEGSLSFRPLSPPLRRRRRASRA